jgi:hypothetical protein
MKNKLEAELKELAKKIQDLDNSSVAGLQNLARELYEKLTILAFTEENLAGYSSEKEPVHMEKEIVSKTKQPSPSQAFSNGASAERDDYLPDGTEYNDSEAITEPNTEKIKDIVAQMPPETQKLDFLVNNIFSQETRSSQIEEKRSEPVKEEPKQEEPKQEQPAKEEPKERRNKKGRD